MELANRAYSAFEVKSIGEGDRRTFSGWATTPSLDRVGDRINPLGVNYANPLSLLSGHKHELGIGTANFGKPTKSGVRFEAEIPVVEEGYGSLKDRVDTAWGELKYGIVRAVSIGFRALKYSFTDTGVDYEEIEVYELSTVTIPALPDAVITAVKSMRPLTVEQIREISRFDLVRRSGGIPLIKVAPTTVKKLEGGAVKLVRASS